MRVTKETEAEKLAIVLRRVKCHATGEPLRVAKRLAAISKKIHTLSEIYCERNLTPAEERLIARHKTTAERLGREWGFTARVNMDPRGVGLKIKFLDTFPDLKTWNGWGGEEDGWCVTW